MTEEAGPRLIQYSLNGPDWIQQCLVGSFSAPKAHEAILVRGTVIELVRVDDTSETVESLIVQETHSFIRKVGRIRLAGAATDRIALATDSGSMIILRADAANSRFERVVMECFGRSGVRRAVAGHYLVVDPKGRAVMVGGIERQKFVYRIGIEDGEVTVSSPLEAHEGKRICLGLTALDVGYEPVSFVSLEVSYALFDQTKRSQSTPPVEPEELDRMAPTKLVYWQVDAGLNHVTKKHSVDVPKTANYLFAEPGRQGLGVVVCCDNFVVIHRPNEPMITCALPRRLETPADHKLQVISHITHHLKEDFICLIQSDLGDLYRLTIEYGEDGRDLVSMSIAYFDSIPIAMDMAVFRTGLMLTASQTGAQLLFKFIRLDIEQRTACSSTADHPDAQIVTFKPRCLRNLEICQRLNSLAPLSRMIAADVLGTGMTQLICGSGQGPRSQLHLLQSGIAIEEIADNELPGRPTGIWAVRSHSDSPYDDTIIVSFQGGGLVLKVGDAVNEWADAPYETETSTLEVRTMHGDCVAQVHTGGFRIVQFIGGEEPIIRRWETPAKRPVVAAAINDFTIVVALQGGELFVFELTQQGKPSEIGRKTTGYEVTHLAVPDPPGDSKVTPFVAVAGADFPVRILSLEFTKMLRQLSLMLNPFNAPVDGLAFARLYSAESISSGDSLSLFVGLQHGYVIRNLVRQANGQIMDSNTAFLEPHPIRLKALNLARAGKNRQTGVFCLGKRPWVTYANHGRLVTMPILYVQLSNISSFNTPGANPGLIGTCGDSLRVFQLSFPRGLETGATFGAKSLALSFTPRCIVPLPPPPVLHPTKGLLRREADPSKGNPLRIAVCEADHYSMDETTQNDIRTELDKIEIPGESKQEEGVGDEGPTVAMSGAIRAEARRWGAVIRVVDPEEMKEVASADLSYDEAPTCAEIVYFSEFSEQPCLVVGTSFNQSFRPRGCEMGSIRVYAYDGSYQLTLLHSTPTKDAPRAVAEYEGRVLVAVGAEIQLLSLGKRQLLIKSVLRRPETEEWVWLKVIGKRVFAGDVRRGVASLRFVHDKLEVTCESSLAQYLTSAEILDYETIAVGDRFGSIGLWRIPEDAEGRTSGLEVLNFKQGESQRCFEKVNFAHIGDIPVSIVKCQFHGHRRKECLVFATIQGRIGALMPLEKQDDADMLELLELVMREEMKRITGREHLSWRSYYSPVKDIIDGTFVEQYATLSLQEQEAIAKRLDKKPLEILRKLEEVRSRVH